MQNLDKFLQFFIDHKDDDRISISKKMKYGFRYYYISFYIDDDPNKNNQNYGFKYRENLEITFDNRNECIEVFGGDEDHPLIIEDKELLKKWSFILEEIVNDNLENRIVNVFEKTLTDCYNKNLHRELQMKKIFKQDESL
jgi:hypothetical protein